MYMSSRTRMVLNFAVSVIQAALDVILYNFSLWLVFVIFPDNAESFTRDVKIFLSGIIIICFAFNSLYGLKIRTLHREFQALTHSAALIMFLDILFACTSKFHVSLTILIASLVIFFALNFALRFLSRRALLREDIFSHVLGTFEVEDGHEIINAPEKSVETLCKPSHNDADTENTTLRDSRLTVSENVRCNTDNCSFSHKQRSSLPTTHHEKNIHCLVNIERLHGQQSSSSTTSLIHAPERDNTHGEQHRSMSATHTTKPTHDSINTGRLHEQHSISSTAGFIHASEVICSSSRNNIHKQRCNLSATCHNNDTQAFTNTKPENNENSTSSQATSATGNTRNYMPLHTRFTSFLQILINPFSATPAIAHEGPDEIIDTSLRKDYRYNMRAIYAKKSRVYKFIKRVFDILASGCALMILSPLFLVTAIAIKLEDGGPVFFSADRYGKDMQTFKMRKFRSMVPDAESVKLKELLSESEMTGHAFKIKNDPRITNVGKFIRKYSIDELPQLWNIFVGEMSVVGPRPIMTVNTDTIDDYDKQRWIIQPGLTCYWQVSGRADIKWAQWIEMDLDYIENMSIIEDVKLIFKTVPVVFKADGAY